MKEASRNGTQTMGQKLWNFLRMVPKQRFYPQCRACSDLQSHAVRLGTKRLAGGESIMHTHVDGIFFVETLVPVYKKHVRLYL